jgi:uncharacterized protein YbjT (DUF2867 family)
VDNREILERSGFLTLRDGNTVRVSPRLFQPIAADDVAAVVADVALAAPRNGIVEIAGPERAPFNEIVARPAAARLWVRVIE